MPHEQNLLHGTEASLTMEPLRSAGVTVEVSHPLFVRSLDSAGLPPPVLLWSNNAAAPDYFRLFVDGNCMRTDRTLHACNLFRQAAADPMFVTGS